MNTCHFAAKNSFYNLRCEEAAVGDDGNSQFSLMRHLEHANEVTVKQRLAFALKFNVFKVWVQLEDFLKRIEREISLGHLAPGTEPAGKVAAGGGFNLCVANGQRDKPLWAQYTEERSLRLWLIWHPKMRSNPCAGLSEYSYYP